MIFDLHSHSNFSDGALAPDELVARAKARGVTALALTDHDTIAGLEIAHKAALNQGIDFIPGIEFSSQWGKGGVHIVGLGIDPAAPALTTAIAAQATSRERRSEAIAQRLARCGFPGALAGAQALAGDGTLGRPHFAQYLVNLGAVKSINAAFKKYLGTGKPADVKYQWPAMAEVIHWIHGAGGIAVLAHPAKYELTRMKLCALVDDFASAGGDGLEVISGQQTAAVTQDLAKIANNRTLYASCGSDFHAPDHPWQELGGFGELPPGTRPVWNQLGFYN